MNFTWNKLSCNKLVELLQLIVKCSSKLFFKLCYWDRNQLFKNSISRKLFKHCITRRQTGFSSKALRQVHFVPKRKPWRNKLKHWALNACSWLTKKSNSNRSLKMLKWRNKLCFSWTTASAFLFFQQNILLQQNTHSYNHEH